MSTNTSKPVRIVLEGVVCAIGVLIAFFGASRGNVTLGIIGLFLMEIPALSLAGLVFGKWGINPAWFQIVIAIMGGAAVIIGPAMALHLTDLIVVEGVGLLGFLWAIRYPKYE